MRRSFENGLAAFSCKGLTLPTPLGCGLWRRRFAGVVLGIDHDVALGRFPGTLGTQIFEIAQGQVQDTALTR